MRIHFVGIKGVGMAPLALIAKEAGCAVTGSDIADAFITDEILQKSDITPFVGFAPEHVVGADMVITTGAHGGYDNGEVVEAKKLGIPLLTQGQAVAAFMKGELFGQKYTGISVTGTHGKTTTSAMVAKILSDAGTDPSWVVGTSHIPSLGFSGHFGQGKYFVAEADEYANEPQYDKTPKMLLQRPMVAIITNIEHDHPDVYPTKEDAIHAFTQFANNLPEDGLLITCGDSEEVQQLLQHFSGTVWTYGKEKQNDYVISRIEKTPAGVNWLVTKGEETIPLSLSLSGEHNGLNATAAYLVGKFCGVAQDTIQKSLRHFSGTKRRMEYIGQLPSGALLYDDYAHHPTEIEKTLTTLKEKYPDKKIVCLFQPHTFSRTKLLFDQFITSLSVAQEVILADIYPSAREAFDTTISSHMLVERLNKKVPTTLAPTLSDVIKYVNIKKYGEDVVLVTMGAGDIYTIAQDLLENIKTHE